MARRSHDFTPAQRESIIRFHNYVCAACGADDALHADHWISGDSQDEGVCLCEFCNVKAKGAKYIPNKFRLPARDSLNIVTHAEYKAQVKANREAFAAWTNQFRFLKPGKTYSLKRVKHFDAPY
jgi:hypothetical protein